MYLLFTGLPRYSPEVSGDSLAMTIDYFIVNNTISRVRTT